MAYVEMHRARKRAKVFWFFFQKRTLLHALNAASAASGLARVR
jgi:hypothetical protein